MIDDTDNGIEPRKTDYDSDKRNNTPLATRSTGLAGGSFFLLTCGEPKIEFSTINSTLRQPNVYVLQNQS